MTDVSWTLAGVGIDAVVPGNGPTRPDVTPGREREWVVRFSGGGGYTVGESVVGGADAIGRDATDRHQAALDLASAAEAGVVAWGVDLEGKPYYHEQVPTRASVDTLIGRFAPDGQIGRRSRWVLVAGGDDDSSNLGPREARLQLVDLGEITRYQSVDAVRNDLESDTVGF